MAAKLTLYGFPANPYVQRAAVALHECGAEWENVPTNSLNGETRAPEFLALNPFGKIPTLTDGTLTVFESRAIARYVFEKFPETGAELMGRDIAERADVNKWVDVEATSYNPAAYGVLAEALFAKWMGRECDEERLKAEVKKLSDLLDVYEEHLQKHSFLACDRLTFADLAHAPFTALLDTAGYGDLITSRRHVAVWWSKVSARPSWAKIWEGPTVAKMAAARKEAK